MYVCFNSDVLNTFSTQWDFANDIKAIYSIQQLFIECLLYDLLDSKVILENKTNPHSYRTFILVKKYRL